MSLASVVKSYLTNYADVKEGYLRYYKHSGTLKEAIRRAALAELPGGKHRFSHQHRISLSVLIKAKKVLARSDLKLCRTFDELREAVRRSIGKIRGVGELTI